MVEPLQRVAGPDAIATAPAFCLKPTASISATLRQPGVNVMVDWPWE